MSVGWGLKRTLPWSWDPRTGGRHIHDRFLMMISCVRFRKVSADNQAVYCTECYDKIPKIVTLTITETLSWEAGAGVATISL